MPNVQTATPNEDRDLSSEEIALWNKRIFPHDITKEELGLDDQHFRERGMDFRTPSDLDYRIYGYSWTFAVVTGNRRLETLTDDEISHIQFNLKQYKIG